MNFSLIFFCGEREKERDQRTTTVLHSLSAPPALGGGSGAAPQRYREARINSWVIWRNTRYFD